MSKTPARLVRLLADRKEEDTFRHLTSQSGLIDFLSNDYLGFANSETLFSKTFQVLLNEGIASNGSGGSRLLSGNHKLYGQLEPLLTNFYKAGEALVFNSGYDANLGLFGAVPQRGDIIFYDEYVHASIREGIRMSNAKSYSFLHNDLSSLKDRIALNLARNDQKDSMVYVATESVFSMDGDSPDLKAFADYTNTNGYHLIVDEAHGGGVLGKNGEGLVAKLGLQEAVFARTITFGKAFGCHGAAVLGSNDLKAFLVNFAKPLIYTTGLTPHTLATILTAHTFFNELSKEPKVRLAENIACFKDQVKAYKLNDYFIASDTAIQCCVVPGTKKVKTVSKKLLDKGFHVKAIVSPTVAEGQERLRICLHSFNSKEEIGLLLKLLSSFI
ncbi:aminotransferase class I/II-fold pyridoxal phosphate-dependent enzyme [Maribacter confluentis]|uniref:Aminotransferase class I/II-fold pyridoxal phosphate-dependent enzyme n=1 Tax=Maribacter confluentis TaxID=1656093 RepID=A0ABT8RNZ1_9FLAO|nr:aminotransferase class I/II-fold pyridoxal phosphate-dependent enzyme [Maribacter confluentis]MDO1512604.1 aminotransferase class I/II-fold pyridoxal phosphate-dependent enzyme [Maribacter confluentis]